MMRIKKLGIKPSPINFCSPYQFNSSESLKNLYDSPNIFKHKRIQLNEIPTTRLVLKKLKPIDLDINPCSSGIFKKKHKVVNSLNNSTTVKLPQILQSPSTDIKTPMYLDLLNKRVTNSYVKRKIFFNQVSGNISQRNKIGKAILSPIPNDTKKSDASNGTYCQKTICFSAMSLAGTSKGGVIKENQDTYLMMAPFKNHYVFGIFDGHGRNGHIVSKTVKDLFERQFQLKEIFEEIEKGIQHCDVCDVIKRIFCAVDKELNARNYDMKCSGTTCNLVIVVNEHIVCANTGDSRSILICEDDIIQLSRDHKPDLPDEKIRIEAMNGRIEKMGANLSLGPFRVWVKNEKYPGLALSRSFGDQIAKEIGVISEPEIKIISLKETKAKAIVSGSDGVWEYLTNAKVRTLAMADYDNNDHENASMAIVNYAHKLWAGNGAVIDDITALVGFIV